MAGYSTPHNAQYQTVGFANMHQSLSRKVEKIGLPENVMTALPYIPWFIGMIAGLFDPVPGAEERGEGSISRRAGCGGTRCDPYRYDGPKHDR